MLAEKSRIRIAETSEIMPRPYCAARMALTRVFRRFFLPYQPPVLTKP
jgi:hypothetical protein